VARKEARGNVLQPLAQHPPFPKPNTWQPRKAPSITARSTNRDPARAQPEPEDQVVQNSIARAQETKLSLELQPTKEE